MDGGSGGVAFLNEGQVTIGLSSGFGGGFFVVFGGFNFDFQKGEFLLGGGEVVSGLLDGVDQLGSLVIEVIGVNGFGIVQSLLSVVQSIQQVVQ
jgi:hypothetical protein